MQFVLTPTGGDAKGVLTLYANGNVGIGTTNPTYKLDVSGDINGTCIRQSGGSCLSDATLKKNIKPLQVDLDRFIGLNPVTYEWDADAARARGVAAPPGKEYGLLAQEVENLFPEMVTVDEKGLRRVQYGIALDMMTIAALKELKSENDALKARIEKLERAMAQKSGNIDSQKSAILTGVWRENLWLGLLGFLMMGAMIALRRKRADIARVTVL